MRTFGFFLSNTKSARWKLVSENLPDEHFYPELCLLPLDGLPGLFDGEHLSDRQPTSVHQVMLSALAFIKVRKRLLFLVFLASARFRKFFRFCVIIVTASNGTFAGSSSSTTVLIPVLIHSKPIH